MQGLSVCSVQPMEASRVLQILMRHKWLILAAALACAVLAWAGSQQLGREYAASVTVKVRPQELLAAPEEVFALRRDEPREPLLPEVEQAQTEAIVKTISALIKSPAVLGPVVDRLKLALSPRDLQDRIQVDTVSPALVRVTVTGPPPTSWAPAGGAARLANEVVSEFGRHYAGLRAEETRRDQAAVQAQIDTTRLELGQAATAAGRAAGLRASQIEENYRALLRRQAQLRGAETQLLQAGAVQTVDPATAAAVADASAGRGLKLALAGLLLGALVAAALLVLFEALDSRVTGPERAREFLGHPVVAVVPRAPSDWKPRAVATAAEQEPASPVARAFQLLALRMLRQAPEEGALVVAGLAARRGQGLTAALTNLAIALAQMNMRVVLVDGDLRAPSVHEHFEIPLGWGLTDLADGEVPPGARGENVVRPTEVRNLSVVTAGSAGAAPWAAVHATGVVDLIDALRRQEDFVILNTPPAGECAEALSLAGYADGSLVVLRAGEVPSTAETRLREALAEASLPVLGVVLTDVPRAAGAPADGAPSEAGSRSRGPASQETGAPASSEPARPALAAGE